MQTKDKGLNVQVGNLNFTKTGINLFEKLTKEEQKEYLIKRKNPKKKLNEYLKDIKYAKLQRVSKKIKSHKQDNVSEGVS